MKLNKQQFIIALLLQLTFSMKDNLIQQLSYAFACKTADIYRELKKKNEYTLADQILRSSTSIAANVEEAIAGYSKADFLNKLTIALKEARETRFWLRFLLEKNFIDTKFTNYLNDIESIIKVLSKISKTLRK